MDQVNIVVPEKVATILEQFNRNGHEAYVVGGCIRDSLRDQLPNDWDITTSALPRQVKQIFLRTYDTGIQHGTVTVLEDGEAFEVTTYRIEGQYKDARRPSKVSFTSNIEDDLRRRDFTMNAIAYHPSKGIVDPFGGVDDIKNHIIRCVGSAEERFKEDALRMLRAIRFSSQTDFEIEEETFQAICHNRELICRISKERIREELTKILLSEHPEKLLLMRETKLLELILPELEMCFNTPQHHSYHIYDVGTHSLTAVRNIEKNIVLRWSALLHDIGKPLCKMTDEQGTDHFYGHGDKSTILAEKILKRLKFDNKTIHRVSRLVKWHDRPVLPTYRAVRKALRTVGQDIFADLLKVKKADVQAQNPEYLKKRMEELEKVKTIFEEIIRTHQCLTIKQLAVNGRDLLQHGIPEGKEIGYVLQKLLDVVIEEPKKNDKKYLIDKAKKIYEKMPKSRYK